MAPTWCRRCPPMPRWPTKASAELVAGDAGQAGQGARARRRIAAHRQGRGRAHRLRHRPAGPHA